MCVDVDYMGKLGLGLGLLESECFAEDVIPGAGASQGLGRGGVNSGTGPTCAFDYTQKLPEGQ